MVTATGLGDMLFYRVCSMKQLVTFRSGNPGAELSRQGPLFCLWPRTTESAQRPELGCQAFGRAVPADSEIGPAQV